MELEGGCYVLGPRDLEWTERGAWREAPLIGRARGATALSQSLVVVAPGPSPARSYPGSEVVLFVLRGAGELVISGRPFEIGAETGALVRRGETFRVAARGREAVEMLVTVCPECDSPEWLDAMPDRFDDEHPARVVKASDSPSHAMGERSYQVLVGDAIGSPEITQFIGAIPPSKAPPHFHQYEEAITILSGSGRMWTGGRSAAVGPGSAIFLPIGQSHSLECEGPERMRLAGHFYPAGSPAVSYQP
jgi:mannose-6-phosphate isomerase-like protein (cupin superfamily)